MTLPEDFHQASIIACCINPLSGITFSQYKKRVIKIPDQHVVKWGPDATEEGAESQRIAFELINSRIARIPRVYSCYFSEASISSPWVSNNVQSGLSTSHLGILNPSTFLVIWQFHELAP